MNTTHVKSKYLIASAPFKPPGREEPSRILFATRSGKTFLIKEKTFQALEQNMLESIPPEIIEQLVECEALIPPTENEFEQILQINQSENKKNTTLSITIQPTANCQLGCHYCGQSHSKDNITQDLSIKMLDRIKSTISKNSHQYLHITWYGGEPILALKKIQSISNNLIEYCNENNIKYDGFMITNGLSLKPEVYKKLASTKINRFQITIDGVEPIHNENRPLKNGKGSFSTIIHNIEQVTSLSEYSGNKSHIIIRININQHNQDSVTELIDYLSEKNLQKKGISLSFNPISDWGGNNADRDSLSAADFSNKMISWIIYAINKGFAVGRQIPDRSFAPCMVVMPDNEVYDAFGNIYPCYEFPYTAQYEKPEYKIGNLQTIQLIKNDKAITREWYKDIHKNMSPCPNCPLFPVCGGGCAKHWYNGKSGCPSFKSNIQELLLLDYWMTIKKNNLAHKENANPSEILFNVQS